MFDFWIIISWNWPYAKIKRRKRKKEYTIMTELLEKAFNKATNLPSWEQDALAAFILEEVAASHSWRQGKAPTPSSPKTSTIDLIPVPQKSASRKG
jgi:hypothetical protein